MQVSWIDPDEIAKLAAQLEGPLQRDETVTWDIATLPDFASHFSLDESAPPDATGIADALAAPVPAEIDVQGAPAPAQLAQMRDKLREIRSRAQEAGMLPTEKVPVPAPNPESPPTPPPAAPARVQIRIPAAAVLFSSTRPQPAPAPVIAPTPAPTPMPFVPQEGTLAERLDGYMRWARSIAPSEDVLLVDDHGDLLWGGPSRADLALSVVLAAGAGLRNGAEALTRSSVFIRSRLGEQKELSVIPCATCHGTVVLGFLNATGLANDTVTRLREAMVLCIEGHGPAGAGA